MINSSLVYVRHNGSQATRPTYLAALIRETLARFCLKQLLCSYSVLYHALTSANPVIVIPFFNVLCARPRE